MAVRTCRVSCLDTQGFEHAVEVTAQSLYEAVTQALRVFRENEWSKAEAHLRCVLKAYASYYNQVRTHLALDKDAPEFRQAQPVGNIVALPLLAELHHHYVRV